MQGEKTWQTGLKFSLPTPPPPPPPTPPPHPPIAPFLLKTCWIWIHEIWTPRATRLKTAKILLTSFGGTEGEGGGGVVDFCPCLSSIFSMVLGKNNTGTSSHITQVGLRSLGGFWHTWNFSRNGTYTIVVRSHSIVIVCMSMIVWLT